MPCSTVLTVWIAAGGSPAGSVGMSSSCKILILLRQAHGGDGVCEVDRLGQLQQHDVVFQAIYLAPRTQHLNGKVTAK